MTRMFFLLLLLTTRWIANATDSTFYFTTTDSVQLFVRVAGAGKPCLFVHGGPGSTSNYFEATHAAPLLEAGIQMIYFDQRGSGRSKGSERADYSLVRVLRDMEELRTALNIRNWIVMGHSFGGLLATAYAHRYPKATRALLMVNGTLHIPYSLSSHIRFGIKELNLTDSNYSDSTLPALERLQWVHEKLREAGVWYKLMFRNAYEKQWSDSVTNAVPQFNYSFGSKLWDYPEYNHDYTPLTSKIKVPVLVFTGTRDHAVGTEHYRSFGFPRQTVVHYQGGHCPFQEEPQWFAEKVFLFLSRLKL